jgi:regulator of protease activity HflC (stomatin/prohibitin superfamily)
LSKYGLAPPPLPFATAGEKKAAARDAAGAANAATPPAGDANSDGKLAKAEKDAQAAEGAARAEEFAKTQSAKANMDETEKNSIIEPMAYENRQNYNKLKEYAPRPTPEPFIMRTTFY